MNIDSAYILLLMVSVSLMLAQLLVTKKQLEHIFFAIFCGSLAMVAAKHLSADILGPYKYIIGLGTSATCNAMWLVSRAMFRGPKAILVRHIVLATVIALLVMLNQGLYMATDLLWLPVNAASSLIAGVSEITQLMSSTILMLTFWEAIRQNADSSRSSKWLRGLFACSFATGVLLCTVIINSVVEPSLRSTVFPWFASFSALQIMLVTQVILVWQAKRVNSSKQKDVASQVTNEDSIGDGAATEKLNEVPLSEIAPDIISGIIRLLKNEQHYLKHNLKMVDLANSLGVSEYLISRAIRYHFKAKNFNHFVNQYRVEHAKVLLEDSESRHWSILVIGMESGFSSITSFNRAFKLATCCSPNEFRLKARHAKQMEVSSIN